MRQWPADFADLIYLDPPFNSKAHYNVIFGQQQPDDSKKAQVRAFEDTWYWDEPAIYRVDKLRKSSGYEQRKQLFDALNIFPGPSGLLSYLSYMAERLTECQRILKTTGSIYIHCDPTASHHLKLVMDAIFGSEHFRNEIIWAYTGPGNTKRWFPRKHDVILFYTKSDDYFFDPDAVRVPYKRISGTGHNSLARGSRSDAEVKMLEDEYAKRGKTPEDWWSDIPAGGHIPKKERTGYDTQKPLKLLSRIIQSSTRERDIVVDPFCGCGTTAKAADNLNRRWLGIDISVLAIDIVLSRLEGRQIPVSGFPADYAAAQRLANDSWSEFERWAVTRLDGFAPNDKQTSDGGIDGRGVILGEAPDGLNADVLAQVKGTKTISKSAVRDFCRVVERENATCGLFISLAEVPRSIHAEAATLGKVTIKVEGQDIEYPRVQVWSVKDLFNDPPNLPVLPLMVDPYTGQPMMRQQTMA